MPATASPAQDALNRFQQIRAALEAEVEAAPSLTQLVQVDISIGLLGRSAQVAELPVEPDVFRIHIEARTTAKEDTP